MLKVLDLFSGIGGFSLGLERTGGFKTVAFCEIEDYPRKVLAKHWPNVPIHRDVRELDGNDFKGTDLICGGYPCQPFSTAGKRQGAEDDRHLWPEVKRLVATIRPTWCLFENVAGHISMGLDQVLSDLEGEGYTSQAVVIPACAVDAPHRRDRVWIVSHNDRIQRSANKRKPNAKSDGRDNIARVCEDVSNTKGGRSQEWSKPYIGTEGARQGVEPKPSRVDSGTEQDVAHTNSSRQSSDVRIRPRQRPTGYIDNSSTTSGRTEDVAHSKCQRQQGQGEYEQPCNTEADSQRQASGVDDGSEGWEGHWDIEPNVGRVAHGIPNRADRLKQLGNSVVPQVVQQVGEAIMKAEYNE